MKKRRRWNPTGAEDCMSLERRCHLLFRVGLTLVGSPVYFGRFPGFYFGTWGFGDLAERKQLTATSFNICRQALSMHMC